jgi:hypothetical protein
MTELPTPLQMVAWADETVTHSTAILADSARLRSTVRATRAESERVRRHSPYRITSALPGDS